MDVVVSNIYGSFIFSFLLTNFAVEADDFYYKTKGKGKYCDSHRNIYPQYKKGLKECQTGGFNYYLLLFLEL